MQIVTFSGSLKNILQSTIYGECDMKNVELNSMLYQRRMLGLMCALLVPSAVLFGLFGIDTNPPHWYKSVSETFFANSNICMIGLLFSTAVFFLSYRGYDWRDRLIAIIQAIMCFGVIAFPTDTPGTPERIGLFNLTQATSTVIHNISAFTLFFCFGINILLLFTLSGNEMTEQKKLRNTVYRICGSGILVCLVLQLTYSLTNLFSFIPNWFPFTMINEFFILEFFAFAWIVKSESIKYFND